MRRKTEKATLLQENLLLKKRVAKIQQRCAILQRDIDSLSTKIRDQLHLIHSQFSVSQQPVMEQNQILLLLQNQQQCGEVTGLFPEEIKAILQCCESRLRESGKELEQKKSSQPANCRNQFSDMEQLIVFLVGLRHYPVLTLLSCLFGRSEAFLSPSNHQFPISFNARGLINLCRWFR